MKTIKKTLAYILALSMILSATGSVFAAGEKQQVSVYVKPDVAVLYDDDILQFKNELGDIVYPIIFDGSTYLPVRAISGLMKENIQYLKAEQYILIGFTMNSLTEKNISEESPYVSVVEERTTGTASMTNAWLKPDLTIMHDFEELTFRNVNGEIVYPIILNGTTYLPLRSIANLMGCGIDWNAEEKTVSITSKEKAAKIEMNARVEKINDLYESVNDVFMEATKLFPSLGSDDKASLEKSAKQMTAFYNQAKDNTAYATKLNKKESFTEDERAVFEKVAIFTASCEAYVLVMENIAYMAVQGQDFSILQSNLLEAATIANNSMEAAKAALEDL